MQTRNHGTLYCPQGAGRGVHLTGDTYTFKATGAETRGAFALFESLVPPGSGPPPHIHHREDEAFYLLEGELEFQEGERVLLVSAGAFLLIPKGTVHRFKNVGSRPARMLTIFTPAGVEGLFFEAGRPVTEGSAPSPPDQEEIARLQATIGKYHLEIVPPAG
jgi:quercetin dioxygenase-like cupin family protein